MTLQPATEAPASAEPAQSAPAPAGPGLAAAVRDNRTLLLRAALESVLIVLSVFLALFLDEWRSDREARERAAVARTYMVRELTANRALLASDRILPYHVRTAELLDQALSDGPGRQAAFARMSSGEFTGVHPFFPQSVAWRSFGGAEITQRLPPEELFMLARVYDQQEALQDLNRALLSGFLQPAYNDGTEAGELAQARAIRAYLADAIPNERELLSMYDVALSQLKATPR